MVKTSVFYRNIYQGSDKRKHSTFWMRNCLICLVWGSWWVIKEHAPCYVITKCIRTSKRSQYSLLYLGHHLGKG
jgi:hypothetical protein